MNMEIVWTIVGLLFMLLVDFALGVALAIKGGSFKWSLLPETLKSNVLPYVTPLMALGAGATWANNATLEGMFYAFTAGYTVKLVADITAKIKALGMTVEVVLEEDDEMETVDISPN